MRTLRQPLLAALLIVALVVLFGCSRGPTWDPSMGTVTSAQLVAKMNATESAQYAKVPVSDGKTRRDKALAALRREDGGSDVADVLTKAFATGNAGVPLFIGRATYLGQPALVVIEAYGPSGGRLDHKRLWVLSADGTPLYSSTSK